MRTVLVTGANRGIGLATCKILKKKKYKIIGVARSKIKNFPGKFIECDLSSEKEINSTEDKKPVFSILQGSQFSRTTVFVCVGGCQSEFENVNDGDNGNEIMGPHCGLMGDSPL